MALTHVHFSRSRADAAIRRAVILSGAEQSERREIWLEVPEERADWLVEHEDPLLILALFFLMRCEGECRIHAEIDRRLLENLTEHMRIWQQWRPGTYHCPRLVADSITERSCHGGQQEAICAFSGGVDASFALMSHLSGHWGELSLRIPAAVMLHGADISLEAPADFHTAFTRSQQALDTLGVELIPVRTNYREYPCNWNDCHYSAIAAALALFGGRFSRGLMGSDDVATRESITLVIPYGMNYITDCLVNSAAFTINTVGSNITRSERCAFISRFPAIMSQLRVCWQPGSAAGNCGVCEKCLRTALNFMVAGCQHPLPFEKEFDADALRRLKPKDPLMAANLQEVLEYDAHHSHALPAEIRSLLQAKITQGQNHRLRQPPSARRLRLRCLRYSLLARLCTGKQKRKYEDKLKTAQGQLQVCQQNNAPFYQV